MVIWTKDPRPLLTHAALAGDLAAWGNVPPVDRHRAGRHLSGAERAAGGGADRTPAGRRRLRGRPPPHPLALDPLIRIVEGGERLSNIDLGSFRRLARAFAVRGVPAVHASFVTPYPKVLKRLGAAGATLELPEAEERGGVLDGFAEAAAAEGLQLITCCEPGRPMGRCIDGDLLAAFTPPESPAALTADRASARGAAALSASTSAGTFRVRAAASTATLTPHRGSYGHRSILRLPEAGGRRIDMPACPHVDRSTRGIPLAAPTAASTSPRPRAGSGRDGGEYVTLATIDDPAEALVLRASLEEAGVPTLIYFPPRIERAGGGGGGHRRALRCFSCPPIGSSTRRLSWRCCDRCRPSGPGA